MLHREFLAVPVLVLAIAVSTMDAQEAARLRIGSETERQPEERGHGTVPHARIRPAQFSQPAEFHSPAGFEGATPLGTLLGYALANNPEIQAVRYQARAMSARVPQARSLPDPQLATTVFLEEIQTAAGPQEVAISLAQKFPWFGKRALRSRVAYYDAMAVYSRVASTELKVIEQVKRAYFDLYFVQSAVLENRRLEQPLKDVISIARSKYETSAAKSGLESVLQAQIELSKLRTVLVEFEEAKRKAQARLAGVLSLPPQTRIEAEEHITRSAVENTVENLVSLAQSCQPDLEAIRREVARDRHSVELACREYWPDVTMSFSWYEMGNAGISPVSNGRDAFSLGVGVNVPIYRERLDAAVREAQYKTSASLRRYATARDKFQAEVQGLHAQFREHHRVLRILETEILPQADETLKLSMEAYRTKGLAFQQLIDNYRSLLNYRIDYRRREALREQAIASLERAVGAEVTSGALDIASQPENAPLPASGPSGHGERD